MTAVELIQAAIEDSGKNEITGGRAETETEYGKIICDVEESKGRLKPRGWLRKSFYILKPGDEFRSRFSLKKATEILG